MSMEKSGERTERGPEVVVFHAALVVLENAADHFFHVIAVVRVYHSDITPVAFRWRVDFQALRARLVSRASLELGVGTQRGQWEGIAQEASQVVGFRDGAVCKARKNMRTFSHPGKHGRNSDEGSVKNERVDCRNMVAPT